MDLVGWAAEQARRRLEPLGARWNHAQAVGARARQVAVVCEPQDRDILVAAALLHDIGYDPELAGTRLHQLDGLHVRGDSAGRA